MTTLTEKFKLPRKIIALMAAMHFFGNPSKKMKIVGVTGTKGKTTTTTLLYRIAKGLGYKAGLVGTAGNIIDGEMIPTEYTTPETLKLYELLNKMAERGCEYVFMEVSSHGLDQDRVAGIKFVGGIFTNLTQDHFDYHKNFENYFRAKEKLFTKYLASDSFALTNTDSEYGARMIARTKAKKSTYGFAGGESFHGEIQRININGIEVKINEEEVKSKLLGKFNAYNILAAWSACELLGWPKDKVKKIFEDVEPPRGRFEHFTTSQGFMVVVDYAHSPDSLEKIITAVKEIKGKEGRLITVFGCGGDRDTLKRPIMGRIGASMSDIAIFTSDNPRSEDPDKIIEQMQAELSEIEKKKVITIADRREAIGESVELARRGDIILCAGKGHETYQEIKGVKSHFDDLEEYKKVLFT